MSTKLVIGANGFLGSHVTRQLVAAGMPVAALSPLALARWVGERLRGETR